MGDFNKAFTKTMGHEGEYSNDPVDFGGETYKGISRKFHPNWNGWVIIDSKKQDKDFPHNLKNSRILNDYVESFYRETYWNKFLGDLISSNNITIELFDTAVNMGVNRSVTFLQKSLNLLNRNEKMFNDLVEDGIMGSKTLTALNKYLSSDREDFLLKLMNLFQGCHYIEYMRKSPEQEKYARGWLKRVEISKK